MSTKDIKQPVNAPTHVLVTDGTEQASHLGYQIISAFQSSFVQPLIDEAVGELATTFTQPWNTQAVENISATTGLPFADPTQSAWSAQMTERFTFFVPTPRTTEIQLVRNGNFGAYLATDGKFRINYGGTYQTVQPITTTNDWVDVIFSYADNGTSAVTFDVTVNGVDFGTQQVAAYSDEFIRSIWASDYGFLHVASMGYGHLTNAATTKMNNYGDACGSLPSVAGSSVVLAQATSTARPLIGRVPVGGRRNLFTYSNDFSNAVWEKNGGCTVTPNTTLAPDGRMTADTLTGATGTTHDGAVMRRSITSPGSNWYSFISIKSLGAATSARVSYRDGTTGVTQTQTVVLTDDWQEVGRNFTLSNTGFWFVGGTDGPVAISQAQREAGSVGTEYQEVGTTLDITQSGIPDQEYLFFDRGDDILAGTVDAITDGEIIFAGRNGIWHDSLTVSAGNWQIGAASYTGGPAGILAVVGDYICSAVISGRAFTTEERDAIYALARARGAPGVFTLGAELVTNGTFDTDTNWTKGTGWAIAAGEASKASGSVTYLQQTLPITLGNLYMFGVSINSATGAQPQFISGSSGGLTTFGNGLNATGDFSRAKTWNGTDAILYVAAGGSGTAVATIDNVSVKAITLTPWS
jgi:hypothetical protein